MVLCRVLAVKEIVRIMLLLKLFYTIKTELIYQYKFESKFCEQKLNLYKKYGSLCFAKTEGLLE